MIKKVSKVILEFADGSISGSTRIDRDTGDAHLWFSEKEPGQIGFIPGGETTLDEIECAPVTFVFKNIASVDAFIDMLAQTKIAMVEAHKDIID